ncbi:GAF and ANTAR domain-containing protein [Mycolicibacterium hippocampi]|uniref:GAF and ANTAR domain-containing protein n=1 Tax=Mycolicibacterium hippocampi TaxID=659824 RepID=UPI0035115613
MQSFEHRLVDALGDARGVEAADRLCEVCVGIFDVDAAAVSLVFDGANVGTFGASSPQAREYDELQFIVGEGPCLDSVATRAPVVVTDLAHPDERRWPAYGPVMMGYKIRGVCAIPVVLAGEYVGALDFFRAVPGSPAADQIAEMVVAAELIQLPLLDLLDGDLQSALADPEGDAWAELNAFSRTEVSQATGMLMSQLNVDASTALARLRAHAYVTGRSATAVARDILDRRVEMEAN